MFRMANDSLVPTGFGRPSGSARSRRVATRYIVTSIHVNEGGLIPLSICKTLMIREATNGRQDSWLISSFRQMADMQAGVSPERQAFTTDIIVEQA